MMRYALPYLFYTALALCGIFLQAEFFSYLQIFHTKPDLILIITVIAAIKTGWKNGGLAGVVMGFWLDILIGSYFGVNMIVFGCTGLIVGFAAQRIKLNFYPGQFFSVCLGTLISELIYLTCLNLIGVGLPWFSSIVGIIVPTAFYNALLMLLAIPFIYLYRRLHSTKIGYVDMSGGGIVLTKGNIPVDRTVIKRKKSNRQKRKRALERKKKCSHSAASVDNKPVEAVRRSPGRREKTQ